MPDGSGLNKESALCQFNWAKEKGTFSTNRMLPSKKSLFKVSIFLRYESCFFSLPYASSITRQHVLIAMVRRTDERTAFYIIETEFIADLKQFGKFIRVYKALHGQVLAGWLQVLAHGDH